MVKLYCPKCMDVYTPKSSRHHHTDGAYFGTGFPHMLFMVHPEYRPKRPANQFVPRFVFALYGSHLLLCLNWFSDISNGCFTIVSQYCRSPLAGSMVSRFTQWLTSYSCRQPPASRVPSKRSAKNLSRAGWGGIGCVVCPSTWLHSSPIILDSTKTNIQIWREWDYKNTLGRNKNLTSETLYRIWGFLVKTISVLNFHIENKVLIKDRYL